MLKQSVFAGQKALDEAFPALVALGIATAVAVAYVIWELWLRDKFKDR